MATIRKRQWINKSGKHTCYEITYVIDGKQYRKSGYKTKIEAQLDLPNIVFDGSTDIRFAQLFRHFLDRHCFLKCKQSSKDLYERIIKNHLSSLNNKIVKNTTHKDIENLIIELKNKGLGNTTINKTIQLLRVIFNDGIENKFISTCPITKNDKLKVEKPTLKILNEQQIKLFLEVAKKRKQKFYVFLAIALYTGMRRGEMIALEWSDIDFKNSQIKVNKQAYKDTVTSTKNSKGRLVDMPNTLCEILKDYKQNQTSELVFPNTQGNYLHPAYVERHIFAQTLKKFNEVSEEKIQLRLHDLRHTYATYLLSNGISIKYVQEQLGHSSAKMTLDVYAQYMPSVKTDAQKMLDNL